MAMSWKKMRKNALEDAKEIRQQQAQDTRKIYDTEIFETERAYGDYHRENAVQKAINERQVTESMANLGLTDSGLNRTQQTAVQLSYANNEAAIDKAQRQAVDNLELQKTKDLAGIRQSWLADKAAINQSYDSAEADYNASLSGANNTPAAPQGVILTNGSALRKDMVGGLKDNNVTVLAQTDAQNKTIAYLYTDNTTGKSTKVAVGVNPFTGDNNYEKYKKYGVTSADFFSKNGYQPNFVILNGEKVKLKYDGSSMYTFNTTGVTVKKFYTDVGGTRRYWVWNSRTNQYEVPQD